MSAAKKPGATRASLRLEIDALDRAIRARSRFIHGEQAALKADTLARLATPLSLAGTFAAGLGFGFLRKRGRWKAGPEIAAAVGPDAAPAGTAWGSRLLNMVNVVQSLALSPLGAALLDRLLAAKADAPKADVPKTGDAHFTAGSSEKK